MAVIYHVTTDQEWEAAKEKGYYEAASLPIEGFIHCSESHQVEGVLERYFAGKKDLVKLSLDTQRLQSRLQYDLAPSLNEAFPHIYGPINLDAVVSVERVGWGEQV
jgi:uncharacterized protein (DUF952 family)